MKTKQKNTLNQRIIQDEENHIYISNYFKDLENKDIRLENLEGFLFHWSYLENLLLPSLIRRIAISLSLKELPKFDDNIKMAQLINYYYFISHDLDLYKKLKEGNSKRNNIIHDFMERKIKDPDKKQVKEALIFTLEKLNVPILERLNGKIDIPVLMLYKKGWSDSKKDTIQNLDKIIKNIENL